MVFQCWQHRGCHYFLLLGVGALTFLINLGGGSLWDLDEGRNATAALEMYQSGDYIVPRFNSELRVDKPALLYWLQVAAYHVFGVNEFAARLPSAAAALITLLLCYELGRAMFGKATGLLGGLMLASMPMLCGAARFANPDALLNASIVLLMLLFWKGYQQPRASWYFQMGLAAGLAVLAKGPVGFVLPVTIVFLFAVWSGRLRMYVTWSTPMVLVGLALAALPWYIWVAAETKGAFLRGFLMNHNVQRFLDPMENHRGFPFYYVVVLMVGTMPWSIFLGTSLWYGYRSLGIKKETPGEGVPRLGESDKQDGYKFLFVWMGTFLLFFSFAATKLPNYVLPAVVPLALILARFLERWRQGELHPSGWVMSLSIALLMVSGFSFGIGMAIAGGAAAVPFWSFSMKGLAHLAILAVIPIAAGLVCWSCLRRNQRLAFVVVLLVTAITFLAPLAAWASSALNDGKAIKSLVSEVGARRLHEDIRIGGWQMEVLPSLNFYTGRDVEYLQTAEESLAFLDYPIPVYLFLPIREWEAIRERVPAGCQECGRRRDLFSRRNVVVVTNRP